jgi:iron complex outermembrane receptor protein
MQGYKKRPLAALVATLFLAPGALHAQQADQQLPEVRVRGTTETLPEIGYQPQRASTATRTDADIMEVPQAINVVPAQVLRDQGARTLDEALRNVSGITQNNTYGNTSDSAIKRGFGTNGDGSILRDGIRSQLPRNVSATTERVEVLKGPASLLWGIQEPGGVINVVSKKPLYERFSTVEGSLSSFGGGSGSIDLTGPVGDTGLAYRLVAERQREDYWRNFGEFRNTLIAPSLAWRNRDTSVLLQYEHLDFKVPFDRGTVILNGRPAPIPGDRRVDEPWTRSEGETHLLAATLEHAFTDGLKGRLTFGWNNLYYDDYQARPRALAANGNLTRSADGNLDGEGETRYLGADLVAKFQLGGMRHELLTGADHEIQDSFRGDSITGPVVGGFNIFNPVYGLLPQGTVVNAGFSDFSSKLSSSAVYVQDSIHLTEQWIAVLGLRHQTFDQSSGQGRPFVVASDFEGKKTLPRLGLVWRPLKTLSIYANYSESFKPNAPSATAPGPFDPESGQVKEIGVKADVAAGITATAALFEIEKENVLVTENLVTRAVGAARSRGIELDLSGRLTNRFDLIASYAYLDAKITKDLPANVGKLLTNVPRNTASLFLVHHIGAPADGGRWRTGGGFRYVGQRAGDTANSFYLGDYTVADAFVSYETRIAGRPGRLQLNVKNLADKTYYKSSGGNLRIDVGEPRQVVLQASVEF